MPAFRCWSETIKPGDEAVVAAAGTSSATAGAVISTSLASSWNSVALASGSGATSSAAAIERLEAAFFAVVALRVLLAMGVRPFAVVAAGGDATLDDRGLLMGLGDRNT